MPVDAKTLLALFEKLKRSHSNLKDEVKELCRRSASTAALTTLKSILLQFPPLHNLNDILDDMSATPNMKIQRSSTSPRNAVTPQTKSLAKRKTTSSARGAASKALKFSPHLFKVEPSN